MTEPEADPLSDIAQAFQAGVSIQDRKYRFQTYKQCFVGSEAVDYLLEHADSCQTRDEAVCLGQTLMDGLHLFEHVTRDHAFADDKLFYRFIDENQRGNVKINQATGQKYAWSDFLATSTTEAPKIAGGFLPRLPLPDLEAVSTKDVHVASKVWPLDEHNATLLNNVHPAQWQDPKPNNGDNASHYDLVVIGGGTAGLITASGSAGVGARVAMIEEHMLGGDCLNVGCVPSKTLLHAAKLAHTVRGDTQRLAAAGITVDPSAVSVDFAKVMERVRSVRAKISHHDSAERYSKELGVEIYIGRGVFTSERSVIVNGRTLTFKRAAIATGGYPTLVPMEGLKELYERATWPKKGQHRPMVMTNETIFNMTEAPTSLLVLGSGVIGMELAQAMQRLGTPTTVLGRSGKVLNKEDEDLADIIKQQMIQDGVKFRLNVSEYQKIELTDEVSVSGYPQMKVTLLEDGTYKSEEILCDAILIAAGRRPNVSGMDLEKANVEYDVSKGLIVNDKLQTTNPKIFGVGDCCSE